MSLVVYASRPWLRKINTASIVRAEGWVIDVAAGPVSGISTESVRSVVASVADVPGPLLLALQAVQDEFGYIDPEWVPHIAQVLNVSRAEVHGVLTYYHDLRTTPPPRASVVVCVAEACQANGSRSIVTAAQDALGVDLGARTNEGVELASVYCLGACSVGPAAQISGRLVGRLTVDRTHAVITDLVTSLAHEVTS